MSTKLFKKGRAKFRISKKGAALISSVTINDPMLAHAICVLSERHDVTTAKVIGKFLQDAFDSGITPDI